MLNNFFSHYGFLLEFMIATALFVFSLKRRRYFILRLIIPIALLFFVSFLWNNFFIQNVFTQMITYVIYYIIITLGTFFCFRVSFWAALFCSIGAYATQHFGFKIGKTIQSLLPFGTAAMLSNAVYFIFVGLAFFVCFIIFARKLIRYDETDFKNKKVILLSIVMILFTTCNQALFDRYLTNPTQTVFFLFASYDILCSFFTLCIMYGMFRTGKFIQEAKVMEHLMHQQKSQMQTSKQNIELIHIKCHDIKHQISRLGDKLTKEEINELEKAVQIYDSIIRTGNDALDIVLSEKKLLCESIQIKLDCIADGKKLGFMNSTDIYALMGNAIDNAIEAVKSIVNINRRLIGINIKEALGMLTIHIQNNFEGEIVLENGLPITSKLNKEYHGFGIKSIKMIVEKYRGNFTFTMNNGIFHVNMIFPI